MAYINRLEGSTMKEYEDKVLFTPGPLTCSFTVKQAMLRDLGSRDAEFISSVKSIRNNLLEVAGVSSENFTSVLLQGSGTYSVEAVLQTIVPRAHARVRNKFLSPSFIK